MRRLSLPRPANTAAPALPGGAFLVGGLSLLTGLMLKRPGEDKRVFAEKKDSYNAGIEEGKRLVLEALRPESASPHPSTPSA